MADERQPGCFLTAKEVAQQLGVSPKYVYDHAAKPLGKRQLRQPVIPVVRLGDVRGRGPLRFRQQDIDRFMADQLTGGEV